MIGSVYGITLNEFFALHVKFETVVNKHNTNTMCNSDERYSSCSPITKIVNFAFTSIT